MKLTRLGAAMAACGAIALLSESAVPALAQAPSEAANVADCLCLRQSVDTLGAAMTEHQGAYDASRQEVTGLDAQLQSARMSLDVYNPAAVAQFRQLLSQRDAAFRRSSGTLFTQYSNAVAVYNERANEFNARCANRPTNPVLISRVQATLVCPAAP